MILTIFVFCPKLNTLFYHSATPERLYKLFPKKKARIELLIKAL